MKKLEHKITINGKTLDNSKLGVYLEIGDKLKKYRTAAGYTQREFAQRLKTPVSTYSNYENGNRVPNVDFLVKAASELSIPVTRLISAENLSSVDEDWTEAQNQKLTSMRAYLFNNHLSDINDSVMFTEFLLKLGYRVYLNPEWM